MLRKIFTDICVPVSAALRWFFLGTLKFALLIIYQTALGASETDPRDREFLYSTFSIRSGQESLALKFRDKLSEHYQISLTRSVNNRSIIDAIVANPALTGLVRLDIFLDYLDSHPEMVGKLELYGDIPACVFAAIKNSETKTDVATESDMALTKKIDLGPFSDEDSVFMYRAIWPDLETLQPFDSETFEFIGGFRALDRVAKSATSAAVFIDLPEQASLRIKFIKEHSSLNLAGVPRSSAQQDEAVWDGLGAKGYSLMNVSIHNKSLFSGGLKVRTICTSLGVLVNSGLTQQEDHRYIDAVVAAISAENLTVNSRFEVFRDRSKAWLADLKTIMSAQVERALNALSSLETIKF